MEDVGANLLTYVSLNRNDLYLSIYGNRLKSQMVQSQIDIKTWALLINGNVFCTDNNYFCS